MISKKFHNLKAYYIRLKKKVEESVKSGSGSAEIYEVSWPLYSSMSFIDGTIGNTPTIDNYKPYTDSEDRCNEESIQESVDSFDLQHDSAVNTTPVVLNDGNSNQEGCCKQSSQNILDHPPSRKRKMQSVSTGSEEMMSAVTSALKSVQKKIEEKSQKDHKNEAECANDAFTKFIKIELNKMTDEEARQARKRLFASLYD